MKILVLWSSPNKDGLTAPAKDSMIAGMVAGGAEVEEIHLNRQKHVQAEPDAEPSSV